VGLFAKHAILNLLRNVLVEYCPESLELILKQGRIEDEEVIKKYASQMLLGLQYLHSQGIVHHDVKPSNVLFDQHGTLKFVDFGCSELKTKNAIVGDSDAFKLVGTARYLPPEVVRNEPNAPLSSHDIWAFGCTIGQMATGKIPWHELANEWAVMFQLGRRNIPTLPTQEELSSLGLEFIKACLTQSPFERPTSEQLLDHEWLRTVAQ
jgi:mitogen-activated protein kinase kinase kinase